MASRRHPRHRMGVPLDDAMTRGKAGPGYCRYASPGNPVGVRMQGESLSRLGRAVQQTMESGREIAGILLGETDDIPRGHLSRTPLVINGYAPIRSDSKESVSAQLKAHPEVLEEHIRNYDGRVRVVGFFRSTLRNQFRPTDEDIRLMRDYFGPGSSLLLICQAGQRISGYLYAYRGSAEEMRASGPITIGDFGSINSAPWLRDADQTDLAVPDPVQVPTSKQSIAGSAPFRWITRGWNIARIFVVLGGIGLLLVAAVEFKALRTPQEQVRAPSGSDGLGLKVERAGVENQWNLSWNRSAPVLLNASKGQVSIVDSYLHKELDLTLADLQNSGIVYYPVSNEFSVRLDLVQAQSGRTVSESIRVLANPPLYSTGRELYGGAAFSDGLISNTAVVAREPRRRKQRDLSEGERSGARQGSSASGKVEPASTLSLRNFTPPPAPSRSETIVRSEFPAAPGIVTQVPVRNPGTLAFLPLAPPLPAPSATRQVTMPETTTSEEQHVAGTTGGTGAPTPPAAGQDRNGVLEPPTLIRRIEPKYPKIAQEVHLRGDVQISAIVGTDGLIHNPQVVSGSPMLASAALEAIKLWKYNPARINGHNVPSPTMVNVRFGDR
jgi:TonB family protein